MGDMGDIYNDCNACKKAAGQRKEEKNMPIIWKWARDNGHEKFVTDKGGTVLFRLPDKPKVDFYPTKNKWRRRNATYWGNAEKFIEWYEKQKA